MIFEDIFADEKEKAPGKEFPVLEYPLVHPLDWEAATVVYPSEKGPWLAGGACLRWYQHQPVGNSDLDVFCANARQAGEVIERIRSTGRYHRKHESENATTFHYWDVKHDTQWTLQIITKRYYNSMKEVVDNFDVTVCQLATDGNEWFIGDYTARDIREKNLRMNMPLQPDAVKRLTKYWIYGYRPVEGLLDAIKDNPTGNWKFNPGEDYS